jgi:hypothetical protein
MELAINASNSYRVEVSGWDAGENFFVEKTALTWENAGKKEILLSATLRKGCIVFVRLLQPIATRGEFPVAYQTVEIELNGRDGRTRATLEQLRPRASYKESQSMDTVEAGAASKVA